MLHQHNTKHLQSRAHRPNNLRPASRELHHRHPNRVALNGLGNTSLGNANHQLAHRTRGLSRVGCHDSLCMVGCRHSLWHETWMLRVTPEADEAELTMSEDAP